MYEGLTYEQILQRMLDRVPLDVDKREGSIIYNAIAPVAAEVKQMQIELDVLLNETFADTASRQYLIKRAAERGIVPKKATHAVLKGEFNMEIPIGSRFTSGVYVFVAMEKIGTNTYRMKSEVAGSEGNLALGTLVPVQYITGLTSAVLTEVLIPGEDEEDTEVFRARYFASFESQEFGGNQADYKAKVNALTGVGGCKVSRTPSGGGTVGIVMISSAYGVPSEVLIDDVQEIVDPVVNSGEGLGIAPIGHQVSVSGVVASEIAVETSITYAPGWDWEALEPYAQAAIDAYFLELRQSWQDEAQIIVRIAQIESRLLNLAGVLDVSGTKLNGATTNTVLEANEIPERGTLIG